MDLRDPGLREQYIELGDADLHVVVPDLQFPRVQGSDDPWFGGVKGDTLDTCTLCLEFQFH
jgi:hypothetical protein